MIGAFTWGRCHPGDVLRVDRSPPVQSRPALSAHDWALVDHALDKAIALQAPALDVVVVLAASDAEKLARDLYVFYEPMVSVAIAIGHEDRSVSWHVTDNLVESNQDALRSIIDDANRELGRGALADALASVASNIRRLRPVDRRHAIRDDDLGN